MDSGIAQIDLDTLPDNSIYLQKGIPIEQLRELRSKGLTYRQIGKIVGCSHANVIMRLEGFGTEVDDTKAFKESEADILNGLRLRIVQHITNEDIQKAPLQVKLMAYGIAYDKYRLETGQSTDNVSVGYNVVINRVQNKLQSGKQTSCQSQNEG